MTRPALIGLVLALTVLPAQAGRLAQVEIFDRHTGQVLPVHAHEGRWYVAGEPRHEYEIRIRNTTGRRVLAVASVDGVNVISGQTASPDQSGYVLDANGRVEIAGWRKSLDRIATFYFTRLQDSYAARTGRPGDVGVIGVALFREKAQQRCCWPWASKSAEADAAGPSEAPAADGARDEAARKRAPAAAQAESRLGTGHGRNEDSSVVYTSFKRASGTPDEVITIFYDSRANLIAQGVIPVYAHGGRPNPFPGGFVPDP